MSKLLEQAESAILAIIDEHVAKVTADAIAELRSMQRDRDILRESVKAWQEAEATARRRWQEEHIKCDQARAELAGVTAQRDAHLSWSVELAARNAKLEREAVEARERVREACATLREAIGSNGPESIESFAERAAKRIAELEAKLTAATPAVDEVGTHIRAEREAVIAYITHHAGMAKRNALETAIHQSMLMLLAEHIRAGMHHGIP